MRRLEDWGRLGGIGIAVLAAAGVLLFLGPRLLGAAAGPEAEIITALKEAEHDGVSLAVPGSALPLVSRKLQYARIAVSVDPAGQRAEAFATLDFEGTLGVTTVSTAGVEVVPFTRESGRWKASPSVAPRLVAVVAALEARRQALAAGRPEALSRLAGPGSDGGAGRTWEEVAPLSRRRVTAQAWYARLERDEAVVTEHYRVEGDLPARPVDTRGERPLLLVREGDQFLFSPGLM
ncbi:MULTISPECIES: hypothetical protein [Corallococcus]|uniref:hypothetical protein n=1 Tax=Corallococcus TaxID=83461 RepID=UPI00117D1AA4|nr:MULTISPECIES: hypothetical protein [Corallococcus]NBD13675.1 hypothetical protein [Corallococcus silvisoli]TSC20886.1 hypothetical protein FOF48_35180 [Corallococcus sp. Z5C101001]